jgi:hypothetical protein
MKRRKKVGGQKRQWNVDDVVQNEICTFFCASSDFNGAPLTHLVSVTNLPLHDLYQILARLVAARKAAIV